MIAVRVSAELFDTGAEIAALGKDGMGAVASFTGIVRGDGGLTALTLEHYPAMTEAALRALAGEAASRWSLGGVTLVHRVGRLVPGDPIVLVACASAHRSDALEACAFLIDRLKTDAPFWKRESFADGREVWVEARTSDDAAAARWS
ncbi:molybdenum cofactor biosynthesis protein MoaE [Sphingomonas sp. SUN039]|uniref:molybdenum cofactor biosynthesis protein MoaE n=1 Tax=Sphingomonas sp. SUN039 TaxID=2937787 RepID=UPI002164CFF7|nr:molybdenum cofactor biosynthesis protein MoaE [Sphingomonas sp. SUN039]UVO54095.1 molybdenum cofactor biosynthesis protein MoaE [Sphingomonas sp. SUN039]